MDPEKNVFGQTLKDGQVVEPAAPAPAAKKPEDTKPAAEDIEKNPLVIELRRQVEDVKKNYGGNLSEQRKTIERLEKRITDLAGPKKPEEKPKPVFEKITRVKDLPKEERDAMTEKERELFDALADTREQINKLAEKTGETKPAEKDGEDPDAYDVVAGVQAEAMKLTDGNYTKATELIAKFNSLGFDLTKITAETVAERVASVATLIPDFKPKKEQETGNGGAVKNSGATTGVDAAISAAVKDREASSKGNYAL